MKLSIVTALKDGFPEFRLTIPTVLGQSHRDFEWIVIDDGSARPVADEFPELARDPRVRVLRNEPGLGQTRSLNRGIREARGEWIVRMDGDDLCSPERLARTNEAAARAGAALVFTDYSVIDEGGRAWAEVRMRHPLPASFFRYLDGVNNPICHPTTAFRRLRPNGELRLFREDLVNAQDYALWKEILRDSGPESFEHVPSAELRYRIVRDSLSGARAPEQSRELAAIREGRTLDGSQALASPLARREKDAMQAYRVLYYRFVGHATPASVGEELALLSAVGALPALLPKAAFYLLLRPFRKILLRFALSGIYG